MRAIAKIKQAADRAIRASLPILAVKNCLVNKPPMRIATNGEQLPAANAIAGEITYDKMKSCKRFGGNDLRSDEIECITAAHDGPTRQANENICDRKGENELLEVVYRRNRCASRFLCYYVPSIIEKRKGNGGNLFDRYGFKQTKDDYLPRHEHEQDDVGVAHTALSAHTEGRERAPESTEASGEDTNVHPAVEPGYPLWMLQRRTLWRNVRGQGL